MFTNRTKVVTAAAAGVAAGTLTYLASRSLPKALLAAASATGNSADLLHQFLGTDSEHRPSDLDGNKVTTT